MRLKKESDHNFCEALTKLSCSFVRLLPTTKPDMIPTWIPTLLHPKSPKAREINPLLSSRLYKCPQREGAHHRTRPHHAHHHACHHAHHHACTWRTTGALQGASERCQEEDHNFTIASAPAVASTGSEGWQAMSRTASPSFERCAPGISRVVRLSLSDQSRTAPFVPPVKMVSPLPSIARAVTGPCEAVKRCTH